MKSIKVSTEIIKKMDPCLDLLKNYLHHYHDFDGTLLEFLDLEKITSKDKVWIAVRLLPKEILEVFALDMALMDAYAASYATSVAYVAYVAFGSYNAAVYDAVETADAAINVAVKAVITADVADAYAAAHAYASADAAASAYAADDEEVAYHAAWANAVQSIKYLVSEEGL